MYNGLNSLYTDRHVSVYLLTDTVMDT